MINYLIYLGLIIIPFFTVKGYDSRYPKEMLSIGLSCVIVFCCIYNGLLKKFSNKWIFILITFVLLAATQVPTFLMAFGVPQDNMFIVYADKGELEGLWNYKPIFYLFVYAMLLISLSSLTLDTKKIKKIIGYVACVMAIYVILQKFGLEQWFVVKPYDRIGAIKHPELIGTLGQSTLLACFLTICFPFAVKNHWFQGLLTAIAICLTESYLSISVMILSFMLLFVNNRFLFVGLICLALICGFYAKSKHKDGTNGRLDTWKYSVENLKGETVAFKGIKRPLTGFGAGAFHYVFPVFNKSPWKQAHNEYLEFAYNNGFIGLFLMLMCIWDVLSKSFNKTNFMHVKLYLIAFIGTCISALATFIWQLHAHIFYTVVILSIIYCILEGRINVADEKG